VPGTFLWLFQEEMMRKIFGVTVILLFFLIAGFLLSEGQELKTEDTVKIFGLVTDFKGQPIESATVFLKDDRFKDVATAKSGKDGRYSLNAPKGHYMALAAVKDYMVKYLEYWAWSVPADQDLEINPRFDRLEVYAINAWRPQGGLPSYQIYFRPMSLSMATDKIKEVGGTENLGKLPVIDIAPELQKDDIQVIIDNQEVKILEMNRVREASGRNQYMFGYLIQVTLPEKKSEQEYSLITITLSAPVTGEKGEGCLFLVPAE